MQCYSELLPPTAVTHAIALCFVTADIRNLVVAKTSLLQVFELRHSELLEQQAHLRLLGEYELSGTVTALRSIRTRDSVRDVESLLIACRNAKFSLVRWDHENHRITTTSIHYYESDPIPRQPCDHGATFSQSILTVDPSSRCAALKFGLRQLAILPFRQHGEEMQELDEEMTDAKTMVPTTNGDGLQETPYKKSFVLSLPSLDEELTDIIDIAFLHNYREPTFGILSSQSQASTSLYAEDNKSIKYQVLTLDLEQAASTVLATVEDLPLGLWEILPLPSPVGGAVLVGTNEILHVAQSGKVHAVKVNEFSELAANFSVVDQTSLALKFEDCVVELLDAGSGDILLALHDGTLSLLQLNISGPDVKGMRIKCLPPEAGGSALQGLPSCTARLNSDYIFVGSDEADSRLLRCQRIALSRKRSHADMMEEGDGDTIDAHLSEDENDIEDDDLYGGNARKTRSADKQNSFAVHSTNYRFDIVYTLPNIGPIESICFGRASADRSGGVELVAVTGRQAASTLAMFSRGLRPLTKRSRTLENAKSAWTVHAIKPKSRRAAVLKGSDNLMFVSDGASARAYSIASQDSDPIELTDTEFEREGKTIDINILGQGRWVVHCRKSEIRVYEPDLSLSQIIPMVDENTDAELDIVSVSFCDPYLLAIRNDSSAQILRYDSKTHDVEPIDSTAAFARHGFINGSLYNPEANTGVFNAFMLLEDGSLQIFTLPQLDQVYHVQTPASLPTIIAPNAAGRRTGQKDYLTEVLMADLGPRGATKPYLILRNATDMLTFYEPFHLNKTTSETWTDDLSFRKVPVPYIPTFDEEINRSGDMFASLRALKVGDQHIVSIPGGPPCLVLCEPRSRPSVLRVQIEDAQSIVPTNQRKQYDRGSTLAVTVLTKHGVLEECEFATDTIFVAGFAIERLPFPSATESELRHVAYHDQSGLYAISTCRPVDFLFSPDDTRHPDQDDISSRPKIPQYTVHLYSARSQRIINSHQFEPGEAVTCIDVVSMDVSEHSHEVQPSICVGLALLRGEDMPARGSLVVFQVLPVVSEPDDPETGVKLHIRSRENVKGAVTTIAPFVGGLVGISQGQKIMIRGLKEDGSCLPVAFLDCQCQLVTLKTLWKTGIWLAGDSWKGLWLGGFTEDPYKLTFLGKSRPQMEVVCAEFLPFEGQLFVLIIDADLDLHVLQYDPEDPKTVTGTRLLHRGTFNIGHWPTSMTLLPSTLAPKDMQTLRNGTAEEEEVVPDFDQPLFQVLIATQSGSLAVVTPLDSMAYRRLSNIHGQLLTILEHPAALNPRQYRAADSDTAGSRGIIDGMLVQRIGELSHAKRAEVLARSGSDDWTMRSDLEVITGRGLTWL